MMSTNEKDNNTLFLDVLNKTVETLTRDIISESDSKLNNFFAGIILKAECAFAFLIFFSVFVTICSMCCVLCKVISTNTAGAIIVSVLLGCCVFVVVCLFFLFIIEMIISQKMRCLVYLILLFIVCVGCSCYSIQHYNSN